MSLKPATLRPRSPARLTYKVPESRASVSDLARAPMPTPFAVARAHRRRVQVRRAIEDVRENQQRAHHELFDDPKS